MRKSAIISFAGVLLLSSLPAWAVQAFTDLGTGSATSSVSISKDGTLIGGSGSGAFIAVNQVKTTVTGGTPTDVEYIGGVPTAVGVNSSSASYWQGGTWTQLPKVGGSTNWTPSGLGVQDATNWWVAGYTGDGGSTGNAAIRYVKSTNTTTSVGGPSPNTWSRAHAVADNGAIAGYANYSGNSRNAFYGLPVSWLNVQAGAAGSSRFSQAHDISSDGSTKVGFGDASTGAWQGHYWKPGGTVNVIPLYGPLTGLAAWNEGHSVNGDGTVFGGFAYMNTSYNDAARTAWIWQIGMAIPKSVTQYLADLGVSTTGWQFTNVTGISNDGLSFVGTGLLNGVIHTWAYSPVPEPTALALLSLGACLLIRRR